MPNLLHKNHNDNVMNDQSAGVDPNYNSAVGTGHQGLTGQGLTGHQQGYDNMSGQPMGGITGTHGTHGTHGTVPPQQPATGLTGMLPGHHHHQQQQQQQQFPTADTVPANQNPNAAMPIPHSGGHHTGMGPGVGAGVATGVGAGTGIAHGTHGTHNTHTTGTTGTHTGPTGTHTNDQPLHSSHVQTSTGHSPSTQITLGKLEHAAGTILHSSTLKAKGDAKIAEGEAVKGQITELRNAEAMETHAQLARERAGVHAARGVVHGSTHEAVGNHGVGGMGVRPTDQVPPPPTQTGHLR